MANEHIPVDLTVKCNHSRPFVAPLADKIEFADYSLGLYMKDGRKRDSLLQHVKGDFEQYFLEGFRRISSTTRRKSRDYL